MWFARWSPRWSPWTRWRPLPLLSTRLTLPPWYRPLPLSPTTLRRALKSASTPSDARLNLPGSHQISSIDCSVGSLSVCDGLSGRSFLVDTGADISLFPASVEGKRTPSIANLIAANGTTIKSFGQRSIKLRLSSSASDICHPFRLADVSRPILGSDFFARTGLLVDVKNRQLVRLPRHQSPLLVVPASQCSSNDKQVYKISSLHTQAHKGHTLSPSS